MPLLLGGNPKGFGEPFSEKTRSGKVLHGILRRLEAEGYDTDSVYLADLWANQEDEDARKFDPDIMQGLDWLAANYWPPIALGRYQFAFAKKHLIREVEYAPHPASRRPEYLQALEEKIRSHLSKRSPKG